MLDGREPVGDHQAGAAPHQLGDGALDLLLGLRVHRAGGLVEHQDRRVHGQRARERQQLPLADRDVLAPLAEPVVRSAPAAAR